MGPWWSEDSCDLRPGTGCTLSSSIWAARSLLPAPGQRAGRLRMLQCSGYRQVSSFHNGQDHNIVRSRSPQESTQVAGCCGQGAAGRRRHYRRGRSPTTRGPTPQASTRSSASAPTRVSCDTHRGRNADFVVSSRPTLRSTLGVARSLRSRWPGGRFARSAARCRSLRERDGLSTTPKKGRSPGARRLALPHRWRRPGTDPFAPSAALWARRWPPWSSGDPWRAEPPAPPASPGRSADPHRPPPGPARRSVGDRPPEQPLDRVDPPQLAGRREPQQHPRLARLIPGPHRGAARRPPSRPPAAVTPAGYGRGAPGRRPPGVASRQSCRRRWSRQAAGDRSCARGREPGSPAARAGNCPDG
jgi:hypothetical protein